MLIRIPREPVSPNKQTGKHWRAKPRLSQGWENDLWALSQVLKFEPLELREKRRLSVTRETPTARSFIRDTDNCYGAHKPLCDALKRLALIVDDSMDWLEIAPL